MRSENRLRRAGLCAAAVLLVALTGCRQGMYDQPKMESYEASDFFADGASARPLPAHTVPRGFLRDDPGYWTGVGPDGALATAPPMPVDRALLEHGRQRFDAFCSMCHGRTGRGDGMVVQRGYPQPTSFLDPRLVEQPVGYVYNVITAGFGRMPSYASQIRPDDRWAIATYVKVLQAAQEVPLSALPAAVQGEFEQALREAEAEQAAAGGHGSDHGSDGHGADH